MAPEIENIWTYLGTAWSEFQDKALIEKFWTALASGNQYTWGHAGNVQFSRTIDLMYPTYDYGPETFNIVYSGLITELTVVPVTDGLEQIENGNFEVSTSGWISTGSIPFVRSNTQAHGGSWALKLPANTSSCFGKYAFGGSQLPSSTLEAWFYLDGTTAPNGTIGMFALDANGYIVSYILADTSITGWQKLTLYSQASNIYSVAVYNMSTTNVWVDDVSMKRFGYFEYPLPSYTYSVPTLTYKYIYNGVTYTGTYTEGTDYIISSELDSLMWISSGIHADQRFSTRKSLLLTAPNLYRINPVLGDVWARQCGFKIQTMFPNYNTFGQEKYEHLKQLIWSLDHYQQQAPSIYTLENAYGIARGLPFAYASGIMSYSLIDNLYNVTMDDTTYVFPSGIYPNPPGYYNQFEILASGLDLYDYTTNPTLIDTYTNIYNRRSTLIYSLDASLSGLSFSQDFLNSYIFKIMPEQVQYLIV